MYNKIYFINPKNLFTFLCSLLTLCLISQVLFTYVVKKPTSTTKEEKELENTDLPEVVVCIDPPGLNSTSLERNGYHISTYWRGVLHPMQRSEKFVGWKGGGGGRTNHLMTFLKRHFFFLIVSTKPNRFHTQDIRKIMKTLKSQK